MLNYELRYDNDLKRISYLRKLEAENEIVKIFNARFIAKKRTRKIKNSRIGNNIFIIFRRSITEPAFLIDNNITVNIE
jgi:hypothetical protein